MLADAALKDLDEAITKLREKRGVDILNPRGRGGGGEEAAQGEGGYYGGEPLSYHELAMREDLRVDLRNGTEMKKLRGKGGVEDKVKNHPGKLAFARYFLAATEHPDTF